MAARNTTTTKKRLTSSKKAAPKTKTRAAETAAAKNTRTSAAKKTSAKKAVNARRAVKRPAKTRSKKNGAMFSGFQKLHFIGAALSAALAGLLLAYGKDYSAAITTHYLSENLFAEGGELLTATRTLFETNMLYLAVAALFVSGIWHLALATIIRKPYEKQLNATSSSLRWLGYAVVAPIPAIVIAVFVGMRDVVSIIMLLALVSSAWLFGYAVEKYNLFGNFSWQKKKLALAVLLLPWLALGIHMLHTYVYGFVTFSGYANLVLAALFLLSLVLAALHHRRLTDAATNLHKQERMIIIVHGLLLLGLFALPFVW